MRGQKNTHTPHTLTDKTRTDTDRQNTDEDRQITDGHGQTKHGRRWTDKKTDEDGQTKRRTKMDRQKDGRRTDTDEG
uniref:Candidate secreted effector n=1 Tax=Meloidogyne incognita TaxID=6306 RepID=A0A914NIF7_MELIC